MKPEPAGVSWRDVAGWFWEIFGSTIKTLLGPLAASGGFYIIAGKEFVWSSHLVPGWVLVGTAGVGGLCIVSIGIQVHQWLRRKRTRLVAIEHIGPHALWWQMGTRGDVAIMMPFGDFHVTNCTAETVAIPRSVLIVSYRRWGFLPARRRIDGFGFFKPLDGCEAGKERLHWQIEPPVLKKGDILCAKVCLIDHLGGENWTKWLRWRFQ